MPFIIRPLSCFSHHPWCLFQVGECSPLSHSSELLLTLMILLTFSKYCPVTVWKWGTRTIDGTQALGRELFRLLLSTAMFFDGDIYHNHLVSFLIGKDQLSAYCFEVRIIFPHIHHFIFTSKEFYLPFDCAVTQPCKSFCNSLQSVLFLTALKSFVSPAKLITLLLSSSARSFMKVWKRTSFRTDPI